MLTLEKKTKIVEKHKLHKKDTGSPDVQIALLSEEIKALLLHLKKHPKDLHSRKGLLKMITKRRSFLSYLKKENEKRYNTIIKEIGIKK